MQTIVWRLDFFAWAKWSNLNIPLLALITVERCQAAT